MQRFEVDKFSEILPWSLIYLRQVIALGATVLGFDNEAVVHSGNDLLLTLDDLHKVEMSAGLIVVLADGELRDLHHVRVGEVLYPSPPSQERRWGRAWGGGGGGDKEEEEERESEREEVHCSEWGDHYSTTSSDTDEGDIDGDGDGDRDVGRK